MTDKISIGQQIAEVERELAERGRVYPRLVASGKMRQSIANYHIDHMQAVLATLKWLKENEDAVRAAVAKTEVASCDEGAA